MVSFNARLFRRRRERQEAGTEAARRDRLRSVRFAKQLGVTGAGLEWLARAVADKDGHATQRGNEATRLVHDGFAAETGKTCQYLGSETTYEIRFVTITEAGREIVRQARELGW